MNCAFDLYRECDGKQVRVRTYSSVKDYNKVNNTKFNSIEDIEDCLPNNMSIVELF